MSDLKNTLTSLAERGDPIGSTRLRERVVMDLLAPSTQVPRVALRIQPVVAATVAAAGVLLLIGGLPWILGGPSEQSLEVRQAPASTSAPALVSTTEPSPTSTTTAPTAASTTAAAAVTEETAPVTVWERSSSEALDPGFIWDLAASEDMVVAVGEYAYDFAFEPEKARLGGGEHTEVPHGVVWVSTDGNNWTRIDDPEVFGGDDVQLIVWRVAAGPLGFVASGQDWTRSVLWFSADGYEWQRVFEGDLGTPGRIETLEVAPGGPGWIAIPEGNGPFDAETVLTSVDGLNWVSVTDAVAADDRRAELSSGRQQDPATAPPQVGIWWDYAWNGDQVVAVGRHTTVEIWLSPDGGVSWHEVDAEQSVFDGRHGTEPPGRDQTLAVTFFNGKYIVGGTNGAAAVIWLGTWLD